MGYSAAWRLDLKDAHGSEFDIIRKLRSECEDAEYCITPLGKTNNTGSWYYYQEQLSAFSLKYPDVTFVVDQWGEEYGDVSRTYFKNGVVRVSKGVITFKPFVL